MAPRARRPIGESRVVPQRPRGSVIRSTSGCPAALRDPRLTLAGRALLGYLLAFERDHVFRIERVRTDLGVSKQTLARMRHELEGLGHLEVVRWREGGRWKATWMVYDQPQDRLRWRPRARRLGP